jgi:hypothetical protein
MLRHLLSFIPEIVRAPERLGYYRAAAMAHLLYANLGVICPSCDRLNAPGAAACVDCKAALGAKASASPPKPAAAPPPKLSTPQPNIPLVPPGMKPNPRPPTGGFAPAGPAPSALGTPMPEPSSGLAPSNAPAQVIGFPASVQAPAPSSPEAPVPVAAAGVEAKYGLSVLSGPARGQRFRLPATGAVLGKNRGAILFPDDPHVSPQHCTLVVRDGRLFVRDDSSTSGVFVTVTGQETIAPQTYFCVGQRLFHYLGALQPPAAQANAKIAVYGAPVTPGQPAYGLEEILAGGRAARAIVATSNLISIGLTRCDLSYPNDEGLAARHCELAPAPTSAVLRDLSLGLGTYVRIGPGVERPLKVGDRVRIGLQTLQVEVA